MAKRPMSVTWWQRVWVPIRVYVQIAVHCMDLSVDPKPNKYGTYTARFCNRLRWHRGQHRDSRYPNACWERSTRCEGEQ